MMANSDWEYKDYVHKWMRPYWYKSLNGETELHARLWFWSQVQRDILNEIQQLRDNGWEAISEVGPSAFVVTAHREMVFIDRYETREFRVSMRRIPRNQVEQPNPNTRIRILRQQKLDQALYSLDVCIDNIKVATLRNGESTVLEVPRTSQLIHVEYKPLWYKLSSGKLQLVSSDALNGEICFECWMGKLGPGIRMV